MGGNALKNTFTRRYTLAEFKGLQAEVYLKLKDLMNKQPVFSNEDQMLNLPISFISYYADKDSFGDMDVLLNESFFDYSGMDLQNKLQESFQYNEIYRNTNVWSFDYKEFQIDLIFVPQDKFKTTIYYYAWNDLGNMMGRVANKFGTRYGSYGLSYKIKSRISGNYFKEKVIVSTNLPEIFEFLGYDFGIYEQGFSTINDIFEYAVSTQYFHPDTFQYESLRHEDRTRNKKRDSYRRFLDFIEEKRFLFANLYTFHPVDTYFDLVANTFAHNVDLRAKRDELEAKEQAEIDIKAKFNGDLVMEMIPELQPGKELARYMEWFKNLYYNQFTFEQTLKENTVDGIKGLIAENYKIYKEQKNVKRNNNN